MSELISGKEALIALANDEDVQFCDHNGVWHNAGIHTHAIGLFLNDCYEFRLKPRTITLNNIEVPAPFEPKEYEDCYMLTDLYEHGYTRTSWKYSKSVPAWRTKEEIKQVVFALRSVFKGGV